ncbi:MAG: TRAP transporter TatT component family protein [Myxococcales bacterium]|nr:TRAP transporter TatT component family protein [Myxococcales bacterium]
MSGSQPAAAAEPAPAAAVAKLICEVGESEREVADEILARSGNGLLWLVMPDEQGRAERSRTRGAEEVRAARRLAECLLKHHDAGFDPEQSEGFEKFEAWLDTHVGPEHGETLLSAGAAYFASLLGATSGIDAMLDVPTARLLLERAVAADPRLRDGLGPLILGAYTCWMPKPLGGAPETGLAMLRQAASHGGDLALPMKVAAAELCAFNLQDRALFDQLIAEVLAAEVGAAPFAMIAQDRAESLRDEADDMFLED